MNFGMRVRGGLFAALIMFAVPAAATLAGVLASSPAAAQNVASIQVEGNRRVEIETIRSYFKPGPGGRLDQAQIDDGLKALIETGLFQDVRISQPGGHLLVTVIENPVIGRVAFEGNKKIKDEQLSAEIQSKPRGTLSRPMVQSDAQRIAEIYRHSGRYDVRVNPEIIEQPNNRVDLVFEITEGEKTGVRSVEFVGNHAYSSYRLKDIIKTHESNLLSFLGGGDVYDPDRVEADRDLIRRFYLKHGFADVQVVAALTEYDPEQKGFLVTFKIEEGQQYRVAAVNFESSIPSFDGNALRSFSRVSVGSLYNAEALEKSVEEMQIEASRRGYAFAIVRPRGDRNFETHTVSITFAIDEGPRTYIERINVRGNTRTRDYVIRREFDISEGDAYNRALVDRAERRLKNLDFFKTVKITTEPGSSSDRVILDVDLEEKSTGDFSVSGGYSTTDGALAEVSISERNFLGRGLFAKASVTYGQYARGYSLSFVEPYLLDYRVALGLDLYQREQLANSYISYGTSTLGFSPRLGFALREDLSLQLRYSIYQQKISLPNYLANCNNTTTNSLLAFNPSPAWVNANSAAAATALGATDASGTGLWCYSDGEASLPVRKELAERQHADLGARLFAGLQYARQQQEPDRRPAGRFQAGLRRRRRRRELSEERVRREILHAAGLRYRRADPRPGRYPQQGRQQRPSHARSVPDGPEPGPRLRPERHRSARHQSLRHDGRARRHQILGRVDGTADAVLVPAEGSRPEGRDLCRRRRPVRLPGADLLGGHRRNQHARLRCADATVLRTPGTCLGLQYDSGNTVRTSVGVGLIWASPFGPLRFDYAVPLTKGQFDRVQEFKFGGGTSF